MHVKRERQGGKGNSTGSKSTSTKWNERGTLEKDECKEKRNADSKMDKTGKRNANKKRNHT